MINIDISKLKKLSNEELTELHWMANKHCYKERPVTITEFIDSPRFLKDVWPDVYPLWRKTLQEIYPTPFTSPYTEVIISAATGAGKTSVATIGILYDMYRLGCLIDPAAYYGLSPHTKCVFGVFSANLALAGSVNWADLTKGIEGCPWFAERIVDKKGLSKKNGSLTFVEILPDIGIQTGSRFQHTMGKAIFGALMDEAAFGQDKSGQSQKTYTELFSRMATRFISYSQSGELPGHMWLVSSPKDATDFLQFRIDVARDNNILTTKIMDNIASWEANPKNDSDDKFMVFIGNEFKDAQILEDDAEIPFEDMDYIIYVPRRFYSFFAKDLLSSIMNYAGIRSISSTGIFKSNALISNAMVLNNPFTKNVIQLPFAANEGQIMDYMDMDYFKNIRHPEANRFIHLDAAYSSKTIDRFGLACSYAVLTDRTIYKKLATSDMGADTISDIFEKSEKTYYTDFVLGIEPCKNQEVSFKKVEDFIIYLVKNLGYPLGGISADTFQSKRTLQEFESRDFPTCNISVDRSRDPYLFFKNCVYEGSILMPKCEELRKEMLQLKDDGKKIDHPIGGCFTGDTKVVTREGNIPLSTLAEFGKDYRFEVLSCTPNGRILWMPAKNAHLTKMSDCIFRGTLNNGKTFECTPDHKIMLIDCSFKQAKDIEIGQVLKGGFHLISKEIVNKQVPVYDITVPFTENFALECGMFVHNSKDMSDAVAGSLWNAYTSKRFVNVTKLISAVMNPYDAYFSNMSYGNVPQTPEGMQAMEMVQFERIKSQIMQSGVFKGL